MINRASFLGLLAATAALLAAPPVQAQTPLLFDPGESAWIREHVGVYVWPAPGFPDYDYTIGEQAALAARLGTRIVRVIFEPHRLGQPDFVSLAQTPDYRQLFRDFPVIVLTMPRWNPGEPDGFAATRRAYEAFTAYLRREYAGTEKTFILGFWEGDNAGMTGQAAVDWCWARHEGIAAGIAAVPDSDVRVWEMIECNYDGVSPAPPQGLYTQETCMARTVLPYTAADLYSFSAWMDLPPTPYRRLGSALDALASQAPDSKAFGARNIMIGEAGVPEHLLSPEEQFTAVRQVLAEARQWGVPYLIWWWLSGRELGLVDARRFGGLRSPLWYPFWAAYHAQDDPLFVDDFDEPDLGPSGHLVNHLGGEQYAWSDRGPARVAATVETWQGGGVLRLCARAQLAEGECVGWSTTLGCLDVRSFAFVHLAMPQWRGAEVGLRDVGGREAWLPWAPALSLSGFAGQGVDLGRLACLSLRLTGGLPDSGLTVDAVAFSRSATPPAVPSVPAERTVHMAVQGMSAPEVPLGHDPMPSRLTRFAVRLAEGGGAATGPRLACGGKELRMVERLAPGSLAWVEPGGEGGYEFAAPSRRRLVTDFERCGLVPHNLRWEPEYVVWMPTVPREPCWLECAVNSHYPITGGSFVLSGRKSGSARWGVTVFQGDRPVEAQSVATFQWVERELFELPPDWRPYPWVRIRFWLQVDRDDPGWEWEGNLSLVSARLELDASSAPHLPLSPDLPLTYLDRAGPTALRLLSVQLGSGP